MGQSQTREHAPRATRRDALRVAEAVDPLRCAATPGFNHLLRRTQHAQADGSSDSIRWTLGRFAVVALMSTTMVAAPANAGLVTYDISFSANTFQVGAGGNPAPVDPVTGEVIITFDPTVAVTDSTANIRRDSLNIKLGSAISFSYDPTMDNGLLTIGGINDGAGSIIYNPSTNDFWLFIENFTTTPTFDQLGYTQTSVSSDNLFYT